MHRQRSTTAVQCTTFSIIQLLIPIYTYIKSTIAKARMPGNNSNFFCDLPCGKTD